MLATLFRARAALGLALAALELLAPRKVARAEGIGPSAAPLARLAGAHKLAAGLGLAAARDKRPWLALALLGAVADAFALAARRGKPQAFLRVAALAAIDTLLAVQRVRGRAQRAFAAR